MLRSVIILILFIILGFLFIQGCADKVQSDWKSIPSQGEMNSSLSEETSEDSLLFDSNYEFHHHPYSPERKNEIVLSPIGERINTDFFYVGFVKTMDETIGPAVISPVIVSIEKNIEEGSGKLEIVYLDLPNNPNVLVDYLTKKAKSKVKRYGMRTAARSTILGPLLDKIKKLPISSIIGKAATKLLGFKSVLGLYDDAFNAWRDALDLYDLEPIGLSDTYHFDLNSGRFSLQTNSRFHNTFSKEDPTEVSTEEFSIDSFDLDASKEGRIIKGEIRLSDSSKQIIELTLSDKLINPEDIFKEAPPSTGITTKLDTDSIFNKVRGKEFRGTCRLLRNSELIEDYDVTTSFFERSNTKIEMVVESINAPCNKKYPFNKIFFYFNRQGNKLQFHGQRPYRGYFYESLELDEPSPDSGWLLPFTPSKIGFDEPYPYNFNYQYAREGTYTPFNVQETTLEVSEAGFDIVGLIKHPAWELEFRLKWPHNFPKTHKGR